MQVSVRDLMMSQPPTVGEDTSLKEATRIILDRALGELYVVDENGRLQGIVSDYALLKARMAKLDGTEPVSHFMSRHMRLLSPDMRLDDVAGYFRESCHPRLAVVEGGRVVGQLSRRCVIRAMLAIEELSLVSSESVSVKQTGSASRGCSDAEESTPVRRVERNTVSSLPKLASFQTLATS